HHEHHAPDKRANYVSAGSTGFGTAGAEHPINGIRGLPTLEPNVQPAMRTLTYLRFTWLLPAWG
ncbi:hypothetical protein, partial [Allomesorhizobium alhagi]|uniref:hypothetical protein n=1 Tax=Allomesorhizobium alhagi TaxID=475067 RepID=UPI001AEC5CD3